MGFLILPHPLTNFETQRYHQNEPRFNGVFSGNKSPKKIKDGAYVIVYFDSFGVEHLPEEIKESIGNKNIKANIFWVQANDSVMCGYFCIGFIVFMLANKKSTDYTCLFSPYDFDKNDQITLTYLKDEWKQFYWSNWQNKLN